MISFVFENTLDKTLFITIINTYASSITYRLSKICKKVDRIGHLEKLGSYVINL